MIKKFRKTALIVLGITALLLSGITLHLFDDPEGPNLLVISVMGVVVYFISLGVYFFNFPTSELKKALLTLGVQVVIVVTAYILLR